MNYERRIGMLLYPILEGYVKLLLAMPSLLLGVIVIGLLIMGFIGLSEIRNAIFAILATPVGFYFLCYFLKIVGEMNVIIGVICIIIRLVIDISIICSVIMIIRYFMIGKVKK